jgi:hypothetical protein
VKNPETPLDELPDWAFACQDAPDDPAEFKPIEARTRSLPSDALFRSAADKLSIQRAFE